MALSNYILAFATAGFVAGCATPPLELDSNHPASTRAREATAPPARFTLKPDAETLRTRELLATRARQAEAAAAETPVDQPTKGSSHENH